MIPRKYISVILVLFGIALFTSDAFAQEEQEPEKYQKYEPIRVERFVMAADQRKRSLYWAAFRGPEPPSKENFLMIQDGPFSSGRPGDAPGFERSKYIAGLACEADVVVLADIISLNPMVAENTDFVFSDYGLTVRDVIKTGRKSIVKTGDSITMTEAGGSVIVDGRTVAFEIARNYPLYRGNRYLLFLIHFHDMKAFRLSSFRGIFPVTGNKVKASYYSSTNDVGEMTELSDLIRRLSKNCPNPPKHSFK